MPLGASPSQPIHVERRPDPAAVAQLRDRVADLEGRTDERRLDPFDRAPGVTAVVAPGEDQSISV